MKSENKRYENTFFPLLLVFYELATYLSNDIYLPALPSIAKDFITSDAFAQLTLTMWFLGSVSLQLILGPLSDRYGRRPILLLGGVFFIVSTVICAMAPNMMTLIIARLVQGSAVCSVVVAGYASVHELYDQTRAIRILAWMGSVTVLAPAFGPLLGGLILTTESWRFTFWLLAIWAIIAITLLYKWMPESKQQRDPLDLKSLFHSYRLILTERNFLIHALPFCLIFCSMILWIAAGPFLVINTFQYTPIMFGILQVCIFGSFIMGTQIAKYLVGKIELQKLIALGLNIIFLGGCLMTLSAISLPTFLMGFVLSMMVCTAGSGLVFAPLQRLAIDASTQPMGARMAIFSTMMAGAGVLASVLVSTVYNETLSALAYMVAAVIGLACFVKWGIRKTV